VTLGLIAGCEKKPEQVGTKQGNDEESITAAEREARSDRIRAYFAEKLKRRQIVATTVTRSGQTIDWIRPETQVPDGRLALPPANESARVADPGGYRNPFLAIAPELKQAELTARTELQLDDYARGPEGTVPVVRFNVEKYLEATKILPKNPSDVLQKIPPPAPTSNNRYYAVWQRFGTFFGTAGRINIWDTSGPVNNETSIAQTAVIQGNPMQAIEAGKIELQSLDGDLNPHFFTYFRTNGSASGDWVGGYNTLVEGWIQRSPRVAPGRRSTRGTAVQTATNTRWMLKRVCTRAIGGFGWLANGPGTIQTALVAVLLRARAVPCFLQTASAIRPHVWIGSEKCTIRPPPRPPPRTWVVENLLSTAGNMPPISEI
jgi:hypothetical protein